jgi:outer membrane protein W
VDLTGRYHFFLPTMRWRPYAGLGMRWVKAPGSPASQDDRLSAQVIAGLDFNLTREWSLRIDAKRLLRDDGAAHDQLMKVSLGAGYRF